MSSSFSPCTSGPCHEEELCSLAWPPCSESKCPPRVGNAPWPAWLSATACKRAALQGLANGHPSAIVLWHRLCKRVGFVPFLGMSQHSTLPIGLKIRFEGFLWKGGTGKRMGRKEDPFCLRFLGSSLGNGSAAKGRSTCCTLRWLVWDLLHTYPPGKVFSW